MHRGETESNEVSTNLNIYTNIKEIIDTKYRKHLELTENLITLYEIRPLNNVL